MKKEKNCLKSNFFRYLSDCSISTTLSFVCLFVCLVSYLSSKLLLLPERPELQVNTNKSATVVKHLFLFKCERERDLVNMKWHFI